MMGFYADLHGVRNSLRRVEVISVDDSGGQQFVSVKGLDGEVFRDVYRAQYFGSSGVPPQGSDGLMLLVGGRPDQAVLVAVEHPDKRKKGLGDGERVLYNAHGDVIYQWKDHIKVETAKFEVAATNIIFTGAIQITGNITQAGQISSTGSHIASAHI